MENSFEDFSDCDIILVAFFSQQLHIFDNNCVLTFNLGYQYSKVLHNLFETVVDELNLFNFLDKIDVVFF